MAFNLNVLMIITVYNILISCDSYERVMRR